MYGGVFRYLPLSFRRNIEHSDMWRLRKNMSTYITWRVFSENYQRELKKPKPSLIACLLKTYWLQLSVCVVLQIISTLIQYSTPLLMPHLLFYFSHRLPLWHAIVYLVAIYISGVIYLIVANANYYEMYKLGIQIRSSLTSAIFEKALRVSPGSITSKGEIINLMSTDSQLILDTIPQFILGVGSPIQFIISLTMIYRLIGWYSMISLVLFVLVLPPFAITSKIMPRAKYASQKMADFRIKLITEFISAIRIIKYYAWEKPFLLNIDKSRENEIKSLFKVAQVRAVLLAILLSFPILCLCLTLFSYCFSTVPDLTTVFTAFTYLVSLRVAFIFMPLTITFSIQYVVALHRIQAYLLYPELKPGRFDAGKQLLKRGVSMSIENTTFTWEFNPVNLKTPETLRVFEDINVQVPTGKLMGLIGGVGSGKSSLISTFLQETNLLKGSVQVASPVAYVPQEAFLINGTIRENVLFGQPYRAEWYEFVIRACSLNQDLCMFPAGDMTEVVEYGVNLSGGQKQRLSIARALYSDREIFVFDDPLSAVDAAVCESLFQNVIMYLRKQKKTILLAINQLQYLQYMDYICVMQDGQIIEQGKYQKLLGLGGKLTQLLADYGLNLQQKDSRMTTEKTVKRKSTKIKIIAPWEEETPEELKKRKERGMLIYKEKTQKGSISLKTYLFYMKSGSLVVYGIILALQIIRTVFNVISNVWLARSVNALGSTTQSEQLFYMMIYLALCIGEIISTVIICFVFIRFAMNGSRHTHQRLLKSTANATCSFYDKTPVGRLLSRFSKDINFVDSLLPWQLEQSTNLFFLMITYMVNMAISSVYAIGIILLCLLFFAIFLLLFRNLATQAQRLESSSRAPVFTIFSEILEGTTIIRVSQMQELFKVASFTKLDDNSIDYLGFRYIFQWFNLTLSQFFNFIILLIVLTFVLLHKYSESAFSIDLTANALGNSVMLTIILSAFSYNFIDFEARMNASERILEYEQVEQESQYEKSEVSLPLKWPESGEIIFENLTIEYRPNEPVLKSLSFHVHPREKIGIVGRTGAGKSTLITALFRTTEAISGKVIIDGVDITTLGLFDLRSKLSIIPQVPQIFLGTVRYNLSPFGSHTDERFWSVLSMVSLDKVVRNMPGMLDAQVDEGGGNFSVGQRQMISMARCLLRETKILLLDEATASLDIESDMLIQTMIRTHFVDRTVLTIAHRLITIIDNDRIMILDSGKIVEFDTPKALLENKDGHFCKMVAATGPDTAKYLYDLANKKRSHRDALLHDPGLLEL